MKRGCPRMEEDPEWNTFEYDGKYRITADYTYRAENNYIKYDYEYDSWGNVIKESEHITAGTKETKTMTLRVFYNTDFSPVIISLPDNNYSGNFMNDSVPDRIHTALKCVESRNYTDVSGNLYNPAYTLYSYTSDGLMNGRADYYEDAWHETAYTRHGTYGYISKRERPDGHVTDYTWDYLGSTYHILTTIEQDVEGYTVDGNGDVSDTISPSDYETTTGFDAYRNFRVWETDERGYTTTYAYDSLGRVVEIVFPDDDDTIYWNPSVSAGSAFRNNNPKRTISYDDTDMKVTVTTSWGGSEVYTYDNLGRLTDIEKTIKTRDDNLNIVAGSTTVTTKLDYTIYDEVKSITDPRNNVTNYSYDLMGNLSLITFPAVGGVSGTKSISYNYSQGTRTTTDEEGNITQEFLDLAGRIYKTVRILYSDSITTEVVYDGNSNVLEEKDGRSNITAYTYDSFDRVVEVMFPTDDYYENGSLITGCTPVVTYDYSVLGYLESESLGRQGSAEVFTTHYTTDELGKTIKTSKTVEIKPDGTTSDIIEKTVYDETGNIIAREDGENNVTLMTYGARGQLVSVQDPTGNITSYTYDERDNIKTMTSPLGNNGSYTGDYTAWYYYDELDRLIGAELPEAVSGDGKAKVLLSYDNAGNLIERTEADGGTVAYTYDERNRAKSTTIAGTTLAGGNRSYTTGYTYYGTGLLETQTDPGNLQTTYTYDEAGRLTAVQRPEGNNEYYAYDRNGNRTEVTDGEQNTRRYEYDTMNRVRKETDAEGGITEYRYDLEGNLSYLKDAINNAREMTWNRAGWLLKEETALGDLYLYTYDDAGRTATHTDPNGTVFTYTYTPSSLVEQIHAENTALSLAHTVNNTWDPDGNLVSAIDGTVTTTYNSTGGTYTPDAYGRIRSIGTVNGGKTTETAYTYDRMNRMTKVTYDDLEDVNYQYNTLGQLEGMPGYLDGYITYNTAGLTSEYTYANGVNAAFTYDDSKRLKTKTYTDDNDNLLNLLTLGYDRANNIVNKNNGHYYYDGNNMLKEAEERGAFAVNVGLKEAEGDLQDIMSVESDFIGTREMTYTAEETEIVLDYGAISIGVDLEDWHQVGSVEIDPEGASWRIEPRQLDVYVSSNNVQGSYDKVTDYLYLEEEGKIIIRMRRPVEARFLKVHCTYDERDFDNNYVDLATVRNAAGSLVTVHYLTHERGEEYTYDKKGNRITKTTDHDGRIDDVTYTYYPNSDRIKSDGVYGYRYDANGNMIGKGTAYTDNNDDISYSATEGAVWVYTYDLFNRLIEVEKSESGTDNLETVATYVYDHRGLRIQRTGKDGEVTHYTYSPAGKVLSEEREGEVTDYIYLGNKLLAKKTVGETFWYLTDHLGSTIMLTDENGKTVWNEGYTAFGERSGETGFDLDESGRYTGKDYDEDTGLYYYNARWYDAKLGRFITEDPAKDSHNWYAYCSNNPLKYVDPSGLRVIENEDEHGNPTYEDAADIRERKKERSERKKESDRAERKEKERKKEGRRKEEAIREWEESLYDSPEINPDDDYEAERELDNTQSEEDKNKQDLNTWEALAGVELFAVGGYLTTAGILVTTGSTAGFSSSITAGLVLTGVTASGVLAGASFITLGATTIAIAIDLIEGEGIDKTMKAIDWIMGE